jgi:hypothetical protein
VTWSSCSDFPIGHRFLVDVVVAAARRKLTPPPPPPFASARIHSCSCVVVSRPFTLMPARARSGRVARSCSLGCAHVCSCRRREVLVVVRSWKIVVNKNKEQKKGKRKGACLTVPCACSCRLVSVCVRERSRSCVPCCMFVLMGVCSCMFMPSQGARGRPQLEDSG